jgi:hypothetical protein
MFNITKKVIENRNYELSALLKKLNALWVQGSLSDEEREELIDLARKNAEVQHSVDVLSKLEELDKRVKALEEAKAEGGEPTTYPDYEVGRWYYAGDKVMFEGVAYECIAPKGQVCTWNPKDFPSYWQTA